jgi:predicted ABC-type sugar transport system permease subunit
MKPDISSRLAAGLPFALLLGAVAFFVGGTWAIHRLTDYGFAWSPNAMQQLAWFVALLISLPTGLIVDSMQPPPFLLAINGAVWGAVLYSAWMLLARLMRGPRRL